MTAPAMTVVIPCGGAKLDHRAAARDLYTGQMFRHTLAAALCLAGVGGRVLILSALHGLVELETELEPYDLRMDDRRSAGASTLAIQATRLGIRFGSKVYALLPGQYFARLDEALQLAGVRPVNLYAAAPGIGYQRSVNAAILRRAA